MIIGLIVGGIVGGSTHPFIALAICCHSVNGYKTALRAFDLQYDVLPDDMADAWDYFGTKCADAEARCNGNGNNIYDNPPESHVGWRLLGAAGMINETLTDQTWNHLIGKNSPKGPCPILALF